MEVDSKQYFTGGHFVHSDNSTPGTPVISTQIFSGDVRVIERNRNFVEFRFTTDVVSCKNLFLPYQFVTDCIIM